MNEKDRADDVNVSEWSLTTWNATTRALVLTLLDQGIQFAAVPDENLVFRDGKLWITIDVEMASHPGGLVRFELRLPDGHWAQSKTGVN